ILCCFFQFFFFFFQAEDGIRDFHVTGVQTCALPIFAVVKRPGFDGTLSTKFPVGLWTLEKIEPTEFKLLAEKGLLVDEREKYTECLALQTSHGDGIAIGSYLVDQV